MSQKDVTVMAKRFSIIDLLLALSLVLFIISMSVVITLNFRPLYYFDIDFLDIPTDSGFIREEIRMNYDALIDYNSIFGPDTLNFPTLPMSETGRIHFEEVKVVFTLFEKLAIVTGLLSIIGIVYRFLKKSRLYLLLAGILTVGIPALLGVLIALNWDSVFIMFHKIVFNNDYWIFDAELDPVIKMLPDTFFMHCAILILALVVLGSAVCFLAYGISKRRNKA